MAGGACPVLTVGRLEAASRILSEPDAVHEALHAGPRKDLVTPEGSHRAGVWAQLRTCSAAVPVVKATVGMAAFTQAAMKWRY